jgi:IclR family pca regulon transcriptional regulator
MGGLAKGLAIIELFAGGRTLTVSDAARGASITPAAARRCLLTLAELGYVRQVGRHFEPLTPLRRLGSGHKRNFAEIAETVISHARDEFGMTLRVSVLDRDDAKVIARAESGALIQTGARVGDKVPAWCCSPGRILLGTRSDAEIRRYLARTTLEPRTVRSIIDQEELLSIIQAARESGVAYSDEEMELGLRSMSVAVRAEDRVIAAVVFSALTFQVSLDEMRKSYRQILEGIAAKLANAWIEDGN